MKGEGGPVSFGVGSVRRLFVLRRAGGPVSFRGCEGGRGASQLWSWVCSSSVFVLRRAGGPVSFRGCGGGRGQSALELGLFIVCFVCFCFEASRRASQLRGEQEGQSVCQEGILSGRDFVRKEFCQGGILSGRNFVRQEFCQEAGSARKRALPGRSFGVCLLLRGTV